MKTETITCDGCGEDITSADRTPRYRLALSVEQCPHISSYIGAVYVKKPLQHTHHFCGRGCIALWATRVEEQTFPEPAKK